MDAQQTPGGAVGPMLSAWATPVRDSPPNDWDEIRSRLRRFQSARGGGALTTEAVRDIERGPRPGRATWCAVEQPFLRHPHLPRLRLWPTLRVPPLRVPRWWRAHDPLIVQRALLIIAALLAAFVLLHALPF